jgi:hypothetical protein
MPAFLLMLAVAVVLWAAFAGAAVADTSAGADAPAGSVR